MPKPKILVVYDKAGKQDEICEELEALGCETVKATNARDALSLVGANTSFAIIHETLSAFDGWKLLECLKGHNKTSQIPVIMLLDRFTSARVFAAQQKGAETALPSIDEPEVIASGVAELLGLLVPEKAHRLQVLYS